MGYWRIAPYLDYVKTLKSRDKWSLLSRFRIRICPLRIETGRYETANNIKGMIPIDSYEGRK